MNPLCARYWEVIADNLSKAGGSWGCASVADSKDRTIWIVDAHGYGKRFIVHADEKLTAFLELECAVREIIGAQSASLPISYRKDALPRF